MERGRHDDPSLTTLPDGGAADSRVRTAVPLSDLRNPLVREALDTWERLRGDRRMPGRAEMTPRLMKNFLKHMALLEVLDGEFRFRVAGDAVILQQGMPLQGMSTADIEARIPGYGAQLRRLYQRVVRRREVFAYRGLYYRPADQHTFKHESIMAPFGNDGETVDHVLIVAA